MLNRISMLTVACLTASASLYVATRAVGDDMTTKTTVTMNDMEATLPTGITAKNLNSDKSIEKAFKAVAEDALDKTGMDNLVDRLVDQDRVRIRKSLTSGTLNNINGSKNTKLNDVIAQVQDNFKSKYNARFDLDIAKVFTADFIRIQTGEVTDANLLVDKWPVAVDAGKVTQNDANQAKDKAFGGDVNLEKGRNVAIAHVMSGHGMSGLNASLIHEAGGWKFDVPNTIGAQNLYDNLVDNLTYLNLHKGDWPADINDTYREFAHAVTAALYDRRIGTDLSSPASIK